MRKVLLMFVATVAAVFACVAAQCQATTKKGTQCKRQASPGSEYCWQHGGASRTPQRSNNFDQRSYSFESSSERESSSFENVSQVPYRQCEAVYKNGPRCNGAVATGAKYCLLHTNYDPENPPELKVDRLPRTDEEYRLKTIENLEKVRRAIEKYLMRRPKKLPATLPALANLVPTAFCPPLKDAWGANFQYEAGGLDYIVISSGKDGKLGTDDDLMITSVKSHEGPEAVNASSGTETDETGHMSNNMKGEK